MTKSLEDYIEAIYVLIKNKGAARVRDVAADLHVKMPSVVKAMAELKKLDLVTQEPYGDIELTAKGRKVATGVVTRHTILKAFLLRLGVSEKVADNDACLMEHILSAQTMDRIRDFLGKAPAKPKPATAKKAKKETK
ncbi:MAG: metal-dependent transcriptional regulator [Kiritimatiellae bacterium]|nr:metal-dependent transcriptional regulator [Kiritimatiellia bacterium]